MNSVRMYPPSCKKGKFALAHFQEAPVMDLAARDLTITVTWQQGISIKIL